MFTVIYNKEDGQVLSISGGIANEEELKNAIPETSGYIFVESLPQVNHYRQYMAVQNNSLVVINMTLSAEQEKFVIRMETSEEMAELKAKLSASDYKTLKFVDGALDETEYAPIRAERAALRAKINELEAKLAQL